MLDSSFFANNRAALMRQYPDDVVVVSANTQIHKVADQPFPFEQDAFFWYLCGVEDPDWRLIIDCKSSRSWLAAPTLSESKIFFDGELTPTEAKAVSGVDEVISLQRIPSLLKELSATRGTVQTLLPQREMQKHLGFSANPALVRQLKQLKQYFPAISDCRLALQKLRAIKQPVELVMLQKAIDITIDGITSSLAGVAGLGHEYEFEAELTKQFRVRGARGHAFHPIISSGKNMCTLHYENNNSPLGNWLLIDVGARYEVYNADLSRTIPIGKTTQRQRDIHEAVQSVLSLAMTRCKPGDSVQEYFEAAETQMGKELVQLGLIATADHDSIRKYFPHALGHGLGIDVHDSLGRAEIFAEDMVMAVEPGIYIPAEKFGVRIEENVHISAAGPVNMSARLPTGWSDLSHLVS